MRYVERALRETIGRYTLRTAAQVLFTTADYGQASHVFPMLSDAPERVSSLPNGVDTARFSPADAERDVRAQLGLPVDSPIALLVARLDRAHYFKGVDVFLHAIHTLSSKVFAVVVGDGNLRTEYERRAKALGIDGVVRFGGQVTDDQLPIYYQAADVTVLPSTTMGEAFGLVLVESMACGTPVIASNLPGVRSVVSHDESGLLVTPGDSEDLKSALHEMLTDEERRTKMGDAGRERVLRDLNWQVIGRRLESIYHSVLPVESQLRVSPGHGED